MPRPSDRLRFPQPIGVAVAQVFGVDAAAIDAETRGRAEVALARQVAMYLAHVACGISLTDVGRMFSRDRTTVAHACAVIEDRRDDQMFDRAIELLELVVRALARVRAGHHRSSI
ncbi:MAG: helix-turn-helix domain-containing protein [Hyphomicrobium sp.]